MSKLVIYHAGCVDGFTAAWAVWTQLGDDAEYLPAHYGDAPPDVTGRDVTIVDFSYPRATLLAMAESAKSILVLDHHKTAEADLAGLHFCHFDMNRSGAGLAWDYFGSPKVFRPLFINYVEDRDLWRWKWANSREVSAWISSWKRESFREWDSLVSELGQNLKGCIAEGSAILRALDGYVDSQAGKAGNCTIAGQTVPVINTTHATSELVGKLAESAPFAVGWFERSDGKIVYSLRSRGNGLDVSEVAKTFGGGGHRNAAGFTVDAPIHRTKDGGL